MMELRHFEEDDSILDDFVLKNTTNDSYQFFKLSSWRNLISNFFKFKEFNLVVYDNERLIAYFPIFLVKSKIFKNHLVSVPFTGHGGGLVINDKYFNIDVMKIFLEEIKKISKRYNTSYLQIRGPEEKYIQKLLSMGFKEKLKDFNFFLDLKMDLSELNKSIDKKLRNIIKKAKERGIKVYEKTDEKGIDDFYRLHLKAMKRLGSPPKSKKFYIDLLKTKKFMIYLAEFDGKIISSSTFLKNKDYATWYDGVIDEKFKNMNSNSLILWKFIEENIREIKTLDLGVSRESSSNYDYKMQWNPKVVQSSKLYLYFKEGKEEVVDVRDKKYNTFSKVWKKFVPNFFARSIGPKIRRSMGS